MMTGTAYTLAQHLLHHTSTCSTEDLERTQPNLFSCYMMITNLSRRLGQKSLISTFPSVWFTRLFNTKMRGPGGLLPFDQSSFKGISNNILQAQAPPDDWVHIWKFS